MTANSTTLKGVSLERFTAPQETMTRYFRYYGSLTTPDCAEAVVWTLFEKAIPLSREQVGMSPCQHNISFKSLHRYKKEQKNIHTVQCTRVTSSL